MQLSNYRVWPQNALQEMEENYATSGLLSSPGSVCQLLNFSPFPVGAAGTDMANKECIFAKEQTGNSRQKFLATAYIPYLPFLYLSLI